MSSILFEHHIVRNIFVTPLHQTLLPHISHIFTSFHLYIISNSLKTQLFSVAFSKSNSFPLLFEVTLYVNPHIPFSIFSTKVTSAGNQSTESNCAFESHFASSCSFNTTCSDCNSHQKQSIDK